MTGVQIHFLSRLYAYTSKHVLEGGSRFLGLGKSFHTLKHTRFVRKPGVPGDLDSMHLTNPPSRRRRDRKKKKIPPIFFCGVYYFVWQSYRRCTPSYQGNDATSHHTPRTRYYTWYCSGLLLGCTLHRRVVIGHTAVLMIHVLVVQRSLTVLRPSQAFHDTSYKM